MVNYREYIKMLDDYIYDMTDIIPYTDEQRTRMQERFKYEWDKYSDSIVTDKTKWAKRKTAIDSSGKVRKGTTPMSTWGRVHVSIQQSEPDESNVFQEVIEPFPELPEQQWWSWQYMIDNTIPFHKDPSTQCWIGINVIGDQEIRFAVDDGERQKDGTPIGQMPYQIALVNSKGLHAPVTDGSPRLILRRVFVHHSFSEIKTYLQENIKCGSG